MWTYTSDLEKMGEITNEKCQVKFPFWHRRHREREAISISDQFLSRQQTHLLSRPSILILELLISMPSSLESHLSCWMRRQQSSERCPGTSWGRALCSWKREYEGGIHYPQNESKCSRICNQGSITAFIQGCVIQPICQGKTRSLYHSI